MTRDSRILRALAYTIIILSFSMSRETQAQYNASIQGVVLDPQGAVIPGATVILLNLETNWSKADTTNGKGIYTFNSLPPSHFSITVTAPGFAQKVLSDIGVIPEQANAVNIKLELGTALQSVIVSGTGATGLDSETATISGTITAKDIENMPSFGRDIFQLAQLAPGTFGDGSQAAGGGTFKLPSANGPGSAAVGGPFSLVGGSDVQIQGNGGNNNANAIMIDGVDTTDSIWGGRTVITPTEESVKDLTVDSNSYDAEDGRVSGAHIQVTTKNGTNTLHGSAFLKADRPGLNAYQRYNGPSSLRSGTAAQKGVLKDAQRFNQYGGSLGGPIWKNKVFGFFAYEGLGDNSITTGTGWYEAPQFLTLAPPGSLAAALLSFPGEGAHFNSILSTTCATIGLVENTQCRTIPGEGLNLGSPLTSPLGTQDTTWTSTGHPGIGNGLTSTPTIAFVNTTNPTTNTFDQYNGRIDVNVTSKDLVTGTLFWIPQRSSSYSGAVRQAQFFNLKVLNNAFTMVWDHTFSPNLSNEVRANEAGFGENQLLSNPNFPWGIPPLSIGALGTATPNSYNSVVPQVTARRSFGYQDVVTIVHGGHQMKFGGVYTHLYYLQTSENGALPAYAFHNMWDLLNDAPYQESGHFDPATGAPYDNRLDEYASQFAAFVQDNYRVKPNLTLNLGLRWEYFGSIYSGENNLPVLLVGTGQNFLTGMSVRMGGHLYTPAKHNFGPRLGFAWSPSREQNRLVIRGGFGISYNQFEVSIQANGQGNFPEVASPSIGPYAPGTPASNILYSFADNLHDFYGYPANPHVIIPIGSNNLPTSGLPIGEAGFPSSIPNAMSYHFSLDTQYDLGHQWIADLGYSGNQTRHLTRRYNQNILAVADGVPFNPQVQSVDWYQNDGNLSFNSLLADLKHSFARSFKSEAQFTWSKGIDDSSARYSENPYEYESRLARGRSDYNVTDAFKLFGTWSPTLFHGSHSWLEKVAGGWSASSIINLHTGFPWTPEYTNVGNGLLFAGSPFTVLWPAKDLGGAGHDTSNRAFRSGPSPISSGFNDNYAGGALTHLTVPKYTVGPAFPARGPLPEGPGIQRNSFNGPNYRDVDMTLLKTFGLPEVKVLGEGAHLEFRADAYNLFNLENLTNINAIISTDGINSNPSFGQAQGGLGSRTVELQVRFQF